MQRGKARRNHIISSSTIHAAYDPSAHGGAVVPRMGPASTSVFPTAKHGRARFAAAYGLDTVSAEEKAQLAGPIYARLSCPSIDAVEETLRRLEPTGPDHATQFAARSFLFPSGMAAVNALVHACCHTAFAEEGPGSEPRDMIVHSPTLYGGTDAEMHMRMHRSGLHNAEFWNLSELRTVLQKHGFRVGLVYVETPANPTLAMVDIAGVRRVIDEVFPDPNSRPVLAVDNTFMGVFTQPLTLGADVVLYSATKYMSGSSNLLAGVLTLHPNACKRRRVYSPYATEGIDLAATIATERTLGGWTSTPEVAHKLWIQLQDYVDRMKRTAANARVVAHWLAQQKKVERVMFPALFSGEAREIYQKQCFGPSGIVSFTLAAETLDAAEHFFDALPKTLYMTVSLGGPHTYAEHPATWTHSDIPVERQRKLGITPGLIRLSIGRGEPAEDIQALTTALKAA